MFNTVEATGFGTRKEREKKKNKTKLHAKKISMTSFAKISATKLSAPHSLSAAPWRLEDAAY